MRDMKFDLQDLDLDEGGIHTELVITHHDGSASYILTDDELKDLHAKVMARFWLRFPPLHLAPVRGHHPGANCGCPRCAPAKT